MNFITRGSRGQRRTFCCDHRHVEPRTKLRTIATPDYDRELESFHADLLVVTEPGPGFAERHKDAVVSPAERTDTSTAESWIALLGSSIHAHPMKLPYSRLAAAGWAVIEGRLGRGLQSPAHR